MTRGSASKRDKGVCLCHVLKVTTFVLLKLRIGGLTVDWPKTRQQITLTLRIVTNVLIWHTNEKNVNSRSVHRTQQKPCNMFPGYTECFNLGVHEGINLSLKGNVAFSPPLSLPYWTLLKPNPNPNTNPNPNRIPILTPQPYTRLSFASRNAFGLPQPLN